MNNFETFLFNLTKTKIPILDASISFSTYTALDLSETNIDLAAYEITNPESCQLYINTILNENKAEVAYGGYLEKRSLYADKSNFSSDTNAIRNIHLGIDYWAKAHTSVLAPINGTVHSFKNNNAVGDYGPTIILSHTIHEITFYTLYGHLSLNSIQDLYIGKEFKQSEILGYLGTPDINVNYAPHLHFQIIKDIGAYLGDYPGVCAESDLTFYAENCPNPNLLLGL
mgnify:CR=1 FL=1